MLKHLFDALYSSVRKDIIVQEIKYYFMGIHYLLEDLDNL